MRVSTRSVLFDEFRFNVPTRELWRAGNNGSLTPVPLGSRAADILLLFTARPCELVTKNEIMDAVWSSTAVEESNLTVQISTLRRALDVGHSGPSAIQTVPGRGYRFTLAVAADVEAATTASGTLAPAPVDKSSEVVGASLGTVSPSSQQPAPAAPTPGGVGRMPTQRLFAVAAVFALLCSAVGVVHWGGFSTDGPGEPTVVRPAERPAPPRLSIVVLPFANSSGDTSNDAMAATLTEDVTTGLAQTGGSFVVARSMAQEITAHKPPLPEIASALGVRYVLEGGIRRSPNGVELKVQLSDAARGVSVWAGQSQGSASEPEDLSTQIAENLMFPLTTAFMDAEARRLSSLPVAALNADDLVLLVRAANNHQPVAPGKNAENIATLEHASALEPMSAEIMIRLAHEILRPVLDYDNADGDGEDRLRRVRDLADRARALAGGSESMLWLQAKILRTEGRYDEAIAAFKALKQAHPTTVHYYQGLALCLMAIGRSEEALPLLQESIKLDHGSAARLDLFGNLGHALVRLGRNNEAITWLLAAREYSSGFSPRINRWLAIAYAHSGNTQAARREFQEVAKRLTTGTVRNLRHNVWGNADEEMKREIDGLAIAGMRDHVDEDADPGLPIATGARSRNLHAPTPLGAPGVSIIRTSELAALIGQTGAEADQTSPLLLSTLCVGCIDIALPGAIWVPTTLRRQPMDEGRRRSLKTWVDRLLGGNPTRRLIAIGWSAEWWDGRNLAIELASLGYPNVSWYRGGLEAWDVAGLPVTKNIGSIAEYDDAIRSDPNSASAFFARGLLYRTKGDLDHAVADYSEAIRLDPKLARAYVSRGWAYELKLDQDHALADYDEATRLDPKLGLAHFGRGRAYLLAGSLAQAQTEFKRVTELNPTSAYPAIWLDIAERRGNLPSHFEQAAKQFNMKAWPAPVVRLLLGELTPVQARAAAETKSQVCEANFYSAELALSQNAREQAVRLFSLAANDCSGSDIEKAAAHAELKALSVAP
jgi:tetratricopeptide (TPR) repeat protein/DNA-binding winged helix-turn-helix (wHTH) protein